MASRFGICVVCLLCGQCSALALGSAFRPLVEDVESQADQEAPHHQGDLMSNVICDVWQVVLRAPEGTDWKAGFEAIAKTAAAQMSTDTIASWELKGYELSSHAHATPAIGVLCVIRISGQEEALLSAEKTKLRSLVRKYMR